MPNDPGENGTSKVEVMDPLRPRLSGGSVDVLAIFANFTERPDLMLEVVEKHDPGFIKRLNQNVESGAEEFRKSKFRFGRFQAYTGLGIQGVAVLGVMGLMFYLASLGQLTFWHPIGLAVFYAVAQGGTHGFLEVAKGLSSLLNGAKKVERSEK